MSDNDNANSMLSALNTSLHHKPRRRHLFPLVPLFFSLAILSLLFPLVSAKSNCLRFADATNINQAFTDGGPGTKVFLCPSKQYRLTSSIVFTAADQELATYGYPTGSERARILVNGDFATLIQGDCRRCARVSIKSLIIDGNRARLGRMVDSGRATGLIVLGGQEGQSVTDSWIRDPRGFTAIHVREGDKLGCKGAVIEKNEIGPVGDEYDPRYDGPDPETSPLGRPLADGISIACKDSTIKDNNFYDNTDAAIVIYCSPGTLVHANTISTRLLSAMGGILMVDSTPFNGDYSGTTVKGNIIDAAARTIRVGIGIGAAVWSDDTETILKGGSVLANGFKGKYMGFGIAAAGLKGWTIKDNWDKSTHQGRRSARCFDEPINPDPVAFLKYGDYITDSVFQPGFVDQQFEYVVCIDGEENPERLPIGGGAQEPAAAAPVPAPAQPGPPPKEKAKGDTKAKDPIVPPAPPPEEQPKPVAPVEPEPPAPVEEFATGSEVMDDILEHSQQRMLESIDVLARRVEVLADAARISNGQDVLHKGQIVMSPQIAAALVELQTRVAGIESRQHTMLETAKSMRTALQNWDSEMNQINEWQYDVLLDVQHRLNLHINKPAALNSKGEETSHGNAIDKLSNRVRLMGKLGLHEESTWSPAFKLVLVQVIFVMFAWIVRRWWHNRNHGKVQ